MTQLRIEVDELPPRVQQAIRELKPGDELVLEEDGVAVAELVPREEQSGRFADLFALRDSSPPIDEDFQAAVDEAVAEDNAPPKFIEWPD